MSSKRVKSRRVIETSAAPEDVMRIVEEFVNEPMAPSVTIVINGGLHYSGGLSMRDSYRAAQAGAQGPRSMTSDVGFTLWWRKNGKKFDLQELSQQLEKLGSEMKARATQPQEYRALAEVQDAAKAAEEKAPAPMFQHLSKAGVWALDVAKQIGVTAAVEVIVAAAGLGY